MTLRHLLSQTARGCDDRQVAAAEFTGHEKRASPHCFKQKGSHDDDDDDDDDELLFFCMFPLSM